MPGAATDEKFDNGSVGCIITPVPATGPTNNLELVIIPVSDDIATGVSQAPHDIEMSGCRGPVHPVGVITLLAEIYIEAAFQQQVHYRPLTVVCCHVQQRPFVGFV